MIKNTIIPYTDEGTALEGYLVFPSEKKRPLVVLCHAWRGRDDFICEKAKQVAALGYVGFAIDMYGKGILGNTKEENAALKKPFIEDRYLLQRRLLAGFDKACTLPQVDPAQIVVLGFGFGGLCALELARSGVGLKGAISIYGHFEFPVQSPLQSIKSKVLILHGYNDPVSPMSELYAFQQELNKDKVDWQSHIYGNTFHAFATPSANDPDSGIMYNATSAHRAWNEVERFLIEIFS